MATKREGVDILMLDKGDFKSKAVTRDKKRHYMMIKNQSKENI